MISPDETIVLAPETNVFPVLRATLRVCYKIIPKNYIYIGAPKKISSQNQTIPQQIPNNRSLIFRILPHQHVSPNSPSTLTFTSLSPSSADNDARLLWFHYA